MKTALVSVSNKNGLIPFVRGLVKHGYRIVSTGGTASHLKENGFNVIPIDEVTGFPEILDGRVKTLHPKLFGGILADSTKKEHLEELGRHAINRIDMVVVNLYPFVELYEKDSSDTQEMIEHIDIGGVTLLRAAAKNHLSVTVVSDIDDYSLVIAELDSDNEVSGQTRCNFAYKAFAQTAEYDQWIASFMRREVGNDDNLKLTFPGKEKRVLRYGENPHQKAYLYGDFYKYFNPLFGKELSYNNIIDLVAANNLVYELERNSCAIIKHTNPCGAAVGSSPLDAYTKALSCDPVSAFGGIIAFNVAVDEETAIKVNEIFSEVVVAPSFTDKAIEVLKKKKNRRIVQSEQNSFYFDYQLKSIPGGMIQQDEDKSLFPEDYQVVTDNKVSDYELKNLKFAWTVCKHTKSNAIVFCKDLKAIGVGAGQMSRVDASRIAVNKAKEHGHNLENSVAASDAFFPFADGVEEIAASGVKSIVQPGGSVRDNEVIDAANNNKVSMIFTGIRNFKH